MSTPPGDGAPSGDSPSEREPDWKRRRRLAAVFGDAVPEQTSDDREPGEGAGKGDDFYRAEVPPHHG